MAEPHLVAQVHPAETWAALGATVTIIIGLVTVLYNRLNADIRAHEIKLEAGVKAFSEISGKLEKISEQIRTIKERCGFVDEELDRLDLEIRNLLHDFTVLKTEHDGCIPRKMSMRGQQ